VAALLDVNVLVAVLVPEHGHHDAALAWFAAHASNGWATCAVTELGVVRVCAQLPGGPWLPERTTDHLLILASAWRAHEFWTDASSPAMMAEVRECQTAKQVTDRYLLGLARRNGGAVVTFDGGLKTYGGDDVVHLPPARRPS
jgi:toxin-antitoxin system PIN domain toxin